MPYVKHTDKLDSSARRPVEVNSMSTIRRFLVALAALAAPLAAHAQNSIAYRLGPGAQMTCVTGTPSRISTRGVFWCKSTDANKLHYTDPSGTDIALGVGGVGYLATALQGTPLTSRATLNFQGTGISCIDNPGSSRTDCTPTPLVLFNVKDPPYNCVGDGSHDDTSCIQAAVNAAASGGGTVYFPVPGKYKTTSTITISSVYPVDLESRMSGFTDNNTSSGNYLMPGANFGATPMYEYQAPGGTHGFGGGGHVHGIVIHDPFNATASFPGQYIGNYTMSAALDLEDFNLGKIDNCQFHVLNGTAIRVVQMVMGAIDHFTIRYSGAASQPALDLAGWQAGAIQSTSISHGHIEVNFGTYLSLNANTTEVKVTDIGMEAETVTTGLLGSNNTMVANAGPQNLFVNVHLNRDNATQWNDTGSRTMVSNLLIADSSAKPATTPSALIAGSESEYHNLQVRGATSSTVPQIHITGTYDRFFGIDLAFSGGLLADTGSFDQFFGVQAASINAASGTAVVDMSGSYMLLDGCMINTPPVNEHGVRVFGTAFDMTVSNCIVFGSSGTGVSFRDENASNATIWMGNHSKASTTSFSASATAYIARGNDWGGVETETIAGKLGNVTMLSGAVLDSNNGLFLGTANSTSTFIGKTGTITTIDNALQINQGLAPAYRSAATPVTLTVNDYFVGVSGTGARAVTLPAASTCKHAGQVFVIQDIGNSSGVITITRAGSDAVNAGTTATIAAAYGRQMLTCDGVSAWLVNPTAI